MTIAVILLSRRFTRPTRRRAARRGTRRPAASRWWTRRWPRNQGCKMILELLRLSLVQCRLVVLGVMPFPFGNSKFKLNLMATAKNAFCNSLLEGVVCSLRPKTDCHTKEGFGEEEMLCRPAHESSCWSKVVVVHECWQ